MKRSKAYLSGILLMLKASFAFSGMALSVKFASRTLPSSEIVFFRSFIGLGLLLALMSAKKVSVFGRKDRRPIMILRGVTGFAALVLHFYTIAHLPLGMAVLLNYMGPIFAAVFAAIWLKEKPGGFLYLMTLVSFGGVWLLVRGSENLLTEALAKNPGLVYLNIGLGILSAVFIGLVYVLIRAIRQKESPLTVIFYFTAVSSLGSLGLLGFGFKWPNPEEWLYLAGVGVGSFYGQLWMTISLRRAPASLVSPFSYAMPILSFLYGTIFFGEKLTTVSGAGILLIILSGSLISWVGTLKKEAAAGS